MTIRPAQRPLVGPRVGDIEVVYGRRGKTGVTIATISPAWPSRSGVVTIEDEATARQLIADLEAVADLLGGEEE